MQTQTQTQTHIKSTPTRFAFTLTTARDSASSLTPETTRTSSQARCTDAWEPSVTPKSPHRPALPAALAEQIHQHPWAKTARSRSAEMHIAAAAANNPAALHAVRQLTRAIWSRAQAVEPTASMREVFGSYEGYDATQRTARYWASGDIHPDDVVEAFEHGNLRECMTMAFNASYRLERHVTTQGERGAFTAPPQSLAAHALSMRRERHATKRNMSPRETAAKLATSQSPPLSDREQRHLAYYLERHRQGSEFERLPTQLGKHRWQPRYDHPFMAEAVAQGLHVTAGVSGSTHRLMAAYRCLIGDTHLEAMRLACVGYFTPHHHALHEVLTAAAWFGCAYDPSRAPAAQLGVQP